MNDSIQTVVLILRSGGVYGFRDVELLSFHLQKQWHGSKKLRILCLFDKVDETRKLINVTLMPMQNKEWPGWWSKMNMFSPDMEQYRPFLYIDLDMAIVGSLEGILPPPGRENQFITLEGFNGRAKYLLSGMMWLPAKNDMISKVWEQWIEDPDLGMQQCRGDQNFIQNVVGEPDERWQNITDKICNFKPRNGVAVKGSNWCQRIIEAVPDSASVVCLHGKPKIFDAAEKINWVKKYINNVYDKR